MTIDILTSGHELKSKLITLSTPFVKNPIVTALLITICIVIIVLLVYTGNGMSIGKVAFWSVLIITSLIFLHDSAITNDMKCVIGNRERQYVTVQTPHALIDDNEPPILSNNQPRKKLKVPVLSSIAQHATY